MVVGEPCFRASLQVKFVLLKESSGHGESRVLREWMSLGKMRMLPFLMWTSLWSCACGLSRCSSFRMDWLDVNGLSGVWKFSMTIGVMCCFAGDDDSCRARFLDPVLKVWYLCRLVLTMSE